MQQQRTNDEPRSDRPAISISDGNVDHVEGMIYADWVNQRQAHDTNL